MEKNVTAPSASITKRSRAWQVLFVGDDGRVFAVTRFKAAVLTIFIVLSASLAAAIIFGILWQKNLEEKTVLRRQVTELDHQNGALVEEVDILTARLVLAESRSEGAEARLEGKASRPEGKKPATGNSGKPDNDVASNGASVLTPKTLPVPDPKTPPQRSDDPGERPEKTEAHPSLGGIETRDFSATYDPDNGALRLRFVIHRVRQETTTTSGYCFVILKGDDSDPQHWSAIPEVPLVNGRPEATARGQFFKISRYKTVSFKVKNQRSPEQFTTASILIYSQDGRIIHEEDIPLSIVIKRRK